MGGQKVIFVSILIACQPSSGLDVKVLPGDVPVEMTASQLPGWGQSAVEVDGVIWGSSEKTGLVSNANGQELGRGWEGRGIWLGEVDGELMIGVAGIGLFDQRGLLVQESPTSRSFAFSSSAWAMAEEGAVRHSDGRLWDLDDPRVVAVDDGRIAALSCVSQVECRVLELAEEIDELGSGEAGGALSFFEGTLWWGLPELAFDKGAGRVVSEFGDVIEGRDGDHLGRSIGGGYAAGSVNGHQVPRVLRVEPLTSGPVFAIDRSAGGYSVALSSGEGGLVMGIPGWVDDGGAVMVVAVGEAP